MTAGADRICEPLLPLPEPVPLTFERPLLDFGAAEGVRLVLDDIDEKH